MYNYNSEAVNKLIEFVKYHSHEVSKGILSKKIQKEFGLTKDRSVFYGEYFAIRFSAAKSEKMSNTVLSLSALRKYDARPFFVCIVTPENNYLLLANTTFLSKISHSSIGLTEDNIKGSFNGSDIFREIQGMTNIPKHFKELFNIHEGFSFEDNLLRLVHNTNKIIGTRKSFMPSDIQHATILEAPARTISFMASDEFDDLKKDLIDRAERNKSEILIASLIDNVNIRGRVIEFLITNDGGSLKSAIIEALQSGASLPKFKTDDNLGDYCKDYSKFNTATDIKTKIMFLSSNPKGYNIDKLLEFLAEDRTVYMIFLVGITEDSDLKMNLVSIFQDTIMSSTRVFAHWAGRNSRGVTQFDGKSLSGAVVSTNGSLNGKNAVNFLNGLLNIVN